MISNEPKSENTNTDPNTTGKMADPNPSSTAVAHLTEKWQLPGEDQAKFSGKLASLAGRNGISDTQVSTALQVATSPDEALNILKVSAKTELDVSVSVVMCDLSQPRGEKPADIANEFKNFYLDFVGETPEPGNESESIKGTLEQIAPDQVRPGSVTLEGALTDFDRLMEKYAEYSDEVTERRDRGRGAVTISTLRNVFKAVRSVDAVDEFVDALLEVPSTRLHRQLAKALVEFTEDMGAPPSDIRKFVSETAAELRSAKSRRER